MPEQTRSQKLSMLVYEFQQASASSPDKGADYLIRKKIDPKASPEDKLRQFTEAASSIAEQITGTQYQIPRSFDSIARSIHNPILRRALKAGYDRLANAVPTAKP